jgi:positive regulator of sigma E activity
MKGNPNIGSDALINKSKNLQSKKGFSSKIDKMNEEDLARQKYEELELEYEQSVISSDRIYLIKVFPIFILFIGLFLIFIHMLFNNETMMTLYIGMIVALSGLIWKIIMAKVEKKRKEQFLLTK